MIMYIAAAFCGIAVLAIDQFTKYYVSSHFVIGETRKFLNGFIDLTYIHNAVSYTHLTLPTTRTV